METKPRRHMTAAMVVTVAVAVLAVVAAFGAGREASWATTSPVARSVPNSSAAATYDGARLTWRSGMNHNSGPQANSLDASDATALARAIEHAPTWGTGTYACPIYDGAAVDVTFTRGSTSKTERIRLNGCSGTHDHKMSPAMYSILIAHTPAGYFAFGWNLIH